MRNFEDTEMHGKVRWFLRSLMELSVESPIDFEQLVDYSRQFNLSSETTDSILSWMRDDKVLLVDLAKATSDLIGFTPQNEEVNDSDKIVMQFSEENSIELSPKVLEFTKSMIAMIIAQKNNDVDSYLTWKELRHGE